MARYVINLAQLKSSAKIFVGRPNGERARKFFGLDDKKNREDSLKLVVPDNVMAINSSFFLGLFGPDVKRIGTEEDFFEYLDLSSVDPVHTARLKSAVRRVLIDPKLMSHD